MIKICKADLIHCQKIVELLFEVHDVHANVRPDLFKKGQSKYNFDQVKSLINDEHCYLYVATIDDLVCGYIICFLEEHLESNSTYYEKSLYIDDLCVSSNYKHMHIGTKLMEYVKNVAKELNCDSITLNVYASNLDAIKFYEANKLKPRKIIYEYKLK